MPDFAQLDPNTVARFWIYFLGSFVLGFLFGFIIVKIFYTRQKNMLTQRLELIEDRENQLTCRENIINQKENKINQFKLEKENDKDYWREKYINERDN